MATKYTLEEINEFPFKSNYRDVIEKDINLYYDGTNWENVTKEVPADLQKRVNDIFNKVLEEYPNRIVIGFKNSFATLAKKAIEVRREMGYGDDIEKFFYDFGFYYDMGPIAQYLAEKKLNPEATGENPYANLEQPGAATIPFENVKVNGNWISQSGKVYDVKLQERINDMCEKILVWYPARMIVNLNKEHKKFCEGSLLSIRRACGYENNNELLADFGFEYGSKSVGNSIFPGERKVEIIQYLKNDSLFQEYYQAMEYPYILYSSKSIYDKEFEEYVKDLSKKLNISTASIMEYVRQHSESQLKELSRRKVKIYYNIDSIKVDDFDNLKALTNSEESFKQDDSFNRIFNLVLNFDTRKLNEEIIKKAIDNVLKIIDDEHLMVVDTNEEQ